MWQDAFVDGLREPTPRSHLVILVTVTAALGLCGLLGLSWGIPSAHRTRLVVPEAKAAAMEKLLAQTVLDEGLEEVGPSLAAAPNHPSAAASRRPLRDDPLELTRSVRRFLTYSTDWDEVIILRAVAKIRPKQQDARPLLLYPGSLAMYPVVGLVGATMALGQTSPTSAGDAVLAHPGVFGIIYTSGRLWILFLILIGVAYVWWAASQHHPPGPALLAMLLYALAPPVHAWLTLVKPHVAAAGVVALCYGFTARAVSRKGSGLMQAAMSAALAGSLAPISGMCLAVVIAGAFVVETTWPRRLRLALVVTAVGVLTWVLLNPIYMFHYRVSLNFAAFANNHYHFAFHPVEFFAKLKYMVANALPWPVMLLAIAGLFTIRTPEAALILVVPAVNAVLMLPRLHGPDFPGDIRFLLPSLPFVCLLAARGFHALTRNGLTRYPALLLLMLGLGWSLAADTFYHQDRAASAREHATELDAATWIDANIPADARIGLAWEPQPAELPPIDLSRYQLLCLQQREDRQVDPPEWFIATSPHPPATGYTMVKSFTKSGTLRLIPNDVSPSYPPNNLSDHRIAMGNFVIGQPLQVHQIPIYVFRRQTTGTGQRTGPRLRPGE